MAKLETATDIDWMACELIEQIPGKVSGRPIVRGTRILPDAIVVAMTSGKLSTSCARDSLPCPLPKSDA